MQVLTREQQKIMHALYRFAEECGAEPDTIRRGMTDVGNAHGGEIPLEMLLRYIADRGDKKRAAARERLMKEIRTRYERETPENKKSFWRKLFSNL